MQETTEMTARARCGLGAVALIPGLGTGPIGAVAQDGRRRVIAPAAQDQDRRRR